MKKIAVIGLAAAMVCSLAACGAGGGNTSYANAAELYKAYLAHEDHANYAMKGDMDITVGMSYSGVKMDMPMKIAMDIQSFDENTMKGDIGMSMEMFGEKEEINAQVYAADGYVYTSESDSSKWMKQTVEEADMFALTEMLDSEKFFANATMTEDEESGNYIVETTLGDVDLDAITDNEMLGGMTDLFDESMQESFLNAMKGAKVQFVFDKDAYLLSSDMSEFEYTGSISQEGVEGDMSMSMAVHFDYSDYGKTAKITVPEDVLKSAEEATASGFGSIEEDESFDIGDAEEAVEEPVEGTEAEESAE